MLQKIGCSLLCASALFSVSSLTMNHAFASITSIAYELPPQAPLEFANAWFWTITATCTIISEDTSNDIFAEALNKQGRINGIPVCKGEPLLMTVHPGDKLIISADSGAKVKLTNLGEHTILASCSAA